MRTIQTAAISLFGLALPLTAWSSSVFVNEIHYDNTGTDANEFVEIAGPAGTSLNGWSLVLYNGSGGAPYNTIDLSGNALNDDTGTGYGFYVVDLPVNGLQNGSPDGLALVSNGAVVQFLSYEGTFAASGGAADGQTSADIGVSEPSGTSLGYSLQLTGSGTDSADFTWSTPAPATGGVANTGQSFEGSGNTTPRIAINEIRIDQPSSDNDEYFELAGTPNTSLDGLTYLVIGDGSDGSGVIESITPLDGYMLNAEGLFVAAESTFTLGTPDLRTDLNFENSDNVTHLLVSGFSGALGEDLDTDDDGMLDSTPWTAVADSVALVETVGSGDQIYSQVTVGPDGTYVPGQVRRCADTGWQIGSFDPANGTDSPGAVNDCEPDPVKIHDVQGNGADSPMVGSTVTIEAVVVGDFQNNGKPDNGDLNGFYLQEEDADADSDANTSEGIFIYDPNQLLDVSVGELVRVSGPVSEYSGMTEITAQKVISLGSTDLPAVTDLSLPVASIDDFEPYEGMRVRFPQNLVISEYYNFDRYGEIVLAQPLNGEARPMTPTAMEAPGSAAYQARLDANLRSRITLDDGRTSQNPDPAYHPNGVVFDLNNRFRGGDQVTNVTGVLDYRYDLYRVQPTQGATYNPLNPRPAVPYVGDGLKVASFNVLNYFSTLDENGNLCGPELTLECRGADNAEEFTRQRNKIISAIADLDADVVGLIEIENNSSAAVDNLVEGLNALVGAGTYAKVDTGTISTDAIKVGFIYKPARVMATGNFAVLDSSVDARFIDTKNRPALAQSFLSLANAGGFTVVVNHLKSKGSDCNDLDDPDTGDGQGNCNLTRKAAAQALVDWLAGNPTSAQDGDYLIIGDLNSYDHEGPIAAITGAGYADLLKRYEGEQAYTYVFDGQYGYLDYALANATLADQVTAAKAWHINADEPDLLDYDTSYKQDAQDALYEPNAYRSSDHDPVVIGLQLTATIANIRSLVDEFVANGSLRGVHGNRGKLKRFLKALDLAYLADQKDLPRVACIQLKKLVAISDPTVRPFDFVEGEAKDDVNRVIRAYIEQSCEQTGHLGHRSRHGWPHNWSSRESEPRAHRAH